MLTFPVEKVLDRLEALVAKGLTGDDELKDLSPNQLRIWRTGRTRAVEQFVDLVGDKPVTEITEADGLDYVDWWRGRVIAGDANAKTADKDIGQLSRMLKECLDHVVVFSAASSSRPAVVHAIQQ